MFYYYDTKNTIWIGTIEYSNGTWNILKQYIFSHARHKVVKWKRERNNKLLSKMGNKYDIIKRSYEDQSS